MLYGGIFLKRALYCVIFTLLMIVFPQSFAVAAENDFPGIEWETITNPAELGWSTEQLKIAQEYANSMDSVGGLVVYDGKILMRWGDINKKGNVHSVRKSLLSALYGIYSAEGKINLSSTMGQLDIEDSAPKLSEQEKQARVIDLLKARSGIYHPAAYETEGMSEKRPLRWSHEPDTFWYYNNWDFNTLGFIFEKETGKKIGEAFEERIAKSIQMQDFKAANVSYIYGNESIYPAYPFQLTARDMARFGLLFLRNGEWQGNQIIPSKWVEESTTSYSNAGRGIGYGYLWWVSEGGMLGNTINEKAYRADGHGGDFIVICPSRDLVVVNLSNFEKTKIDERKEFGHLLGLILNAKTD